MSKKIPNPFDKEEVLKPWMEGDKFYQKSKNLSLIYFKKSQEISPDFFSSLQNKYLQIVNLITKNAIVATIIMLIALTSVSAVAAEIFAPEEFKPSNFFKIENNQNSNTTSQNSLAPSTSSVSLAENANKSSSSISSQKSDKIQSLADIPENIKTEMFKEKVPKYGLMFFENKVYWANYESFYNENNEDPEQKSGWYLYEFDGQKINILADNKDIIATSGFISETIQNDEFAIYGCSGFGLGCAITEPIAFYNLKTKTLNRTSTTQNWVIGKFLQENRIGYIPNGFFSYKNNKLYGRYMFSENIANDYNFVSSDGDLNFIKLFSASRIGYGDSFIFNNRGNMVTIGNPYMSEGPNWIIMYSFVEQDFTTGKVLKEKKYINSEIRQTIADFGIEGYFNESFIQKIENGGSGNIGNYALAVDKGSDTKNLNIRENPCGKILSQQDWNRVSGKILESPRVVSCDGQNYTWWKVEWKDGKTGWSIADNLYFSSEEIPY